MPEARVIYELAHHEQASATQLSNELEMDPGQLSRILGDFKKRGLLDKHPSNTDGRKSVLRLTEKGQEAFAMLKSFL